MKRLSFLLLFLVCFLLPSTTLAVFHGAVGGGKTCVPACKNSSIVFFSKLDSSGQGVTQGCDGGYNFSPDSTLSQGANSSYSSTRVKMGTASYDGQSGGCATTASLNINIDNEENIWDGESDLKIGMWWNNDCYDSSASPNTGFFDLLNGSYFWRAWQTNSGGSPTIQFGWKDDTNCTSTCWITCNNLQAGTLSNDTWYWIEFYVDISENGLGCDAWTAANLWGTNSQTISGYVTTSNIEGLGGTQYFKLGNAYSGQEGDWFMDHVVITTDITDDLRIYANDPNYLYCIPE